MPAPSRQLPPPKKSSKTGDVWDRIEELSDPECGMKVCLYGQSGKGKTTLACTFPKPLLLVRSSSESRRKSAFKQPGIDTVSPATMDELLTIAKRQQETRRYKTVVIDNATEFRDRALKQVLDVEDLPNTLSWGVATQAQWGEVASILIDCLKAYVTGLDDNIVVISQEKEFNTDQSSEILQPYVGAALSESVNRWLYPSVDYLLQCYTTMGVVEESKKVGNQTLVTKREVPEYRVRIGPHPVFNTKFTRPRSVVIPDSLKDPTYEMLVRTVTGGK